MHCIHESVYLLPVAFAAALCRKIVFYQHYLTQPGVHVTNICTFYINLLGFTAKKHSQNMLTSILFSSNWCPWCSHCEKGIHIRKSFSCRRQPLLILLLLIQQQQQQTLVLNIYFSSLAKYILYNLIKKGLITFSTLDSFRST